MNKNLLIGIVIVLLILIGGGYMFLNRSQNPQPSTIETTETTQVTNTAGVVEKKSIKSLLALGSNQTCTFEDKETGSSGTVFIDSGKFRGDFSSNVNNVVSNSHMIADGKDVYVWTDNSKEGFKMSVDSIEKINEGGPKTVDINKEVDYSCTPQGAEVSKFVLPTDVVFSDFSKMIEDAAKLKQNGTSNTTQSPQSNCGVCDSVPAESQAQCREALRC